MVVMTSLETGVFKITLNRPEKRNALNAEIILELTHIFKNASQDKSVKIILLMGAGEHFCAGADIQVMRAMSDASLKENVADAALLAELLALIHGSVKPVVVLAQGNTMGGGLGLIACADIVIAAQNAEFCFSETKIGLTPSVISPYIVKAIGERAASYYFLTAEKFSADMARELGLVHVVADNLKNSARDIIERLLQNSPNALIEAKKIIKKAAVSVEKDLIQFTTEHLAMMRATPDAKEGLSAFLEKRKPNWE